MTLAEALRQAAALGVARLDAQLLLLHALARRPRERAWLIAHDGDALIQHDAYLALCNRRIAGEPLAYLVGEKEFFGLPLQVDARVLVPRPETETLVEWSLAVLREREAPRVIDLGTGSGAIALAIATARPDAAVEAVDRSGAALEVASANARRLGATVIFREADWLQGADAGYDLIVSNPPYVAEGDSHLPALKHEPRCALVSGADGLADIRKIIAAAPPHVRPGGWLLLEHGWDQAPAVRALLVSAGLHEPTSRCDLAGYQRCSGAFRLELG